MTRRSAKPQREPTIALINIVFLMLIFFLVAGTLAAPLDHELSLVRTADLDGSPPADALVIHADGRMSVNGTPVTDAAAMMRDLPEGVDRIRIVPDRDLPAAMLVAAGRALREAGADRIVIVTERGLP